MQPVIQQLLMHVNFRETKKNFKGTSGACKCGGNSACSGSSDTCTNSVFIKYEKVIVELANVQLIQPALARLTLVITYDLN